MINDDDREQELILLDCTLRDGGYYNSWDFSPELINQYLAAMRRSPVAVVEVGFRFLKNNGFKGPCAFTTDDFLKGLKIPQGLTIGVMVNGADLHGGVGWRSAIETLFPLPAMETPVDLVRIACHYSELEDAFLAATWLVERGYRVGINLMQISERKQYEIENFGKMASDSQIEVLYFADSMGSMTPNMTSNIIGWLQKNWSGPIGIHAHDNMRLALTNTLLAKEKGVTWLDATITGMGRGPGNTCMEELVIEAEVSSGCSADIAPMLELVHEHFGPMKKRYDWGTNPYYYLSGKFGIHPSYIQEMLGDSRYGQEDILAVIDYLKLTGASKFSVNTLDAARHFYHGDPRGTWKPSTIIKDREVLLLGSGESIYKHRSAIENYILRTKPLVIALNTISAISDENIDLRIACHPVRLLADAVAHKKFKQPLITPASMLPKNLQVELQGKELLDYGLSIDRGRFELNETHCVVPAQLVLAYALAVCGSGGAGCVSLAGFDGYKSGDVRNAEVDLILHAYSDQVANLDVFSVTPSNYSSLQTVSIYGM
jgi:4-hydroxy 2-oxovalerate aldolase